MTRKYSPPYYLTLGAFAVFLLIGISLTGCTTLYDPESSQVYSEQVIGVVDTQTTFGQSIQTRHSNVNGIVLWLTQLDPSTSLATEHLTLIFYDDVGSSTPLFSTEISISSINQNPQIQASFSPIKLTPDQTFYVELTTTGQGLQILGRQEDCYSTGQAYQAREPIDADMAFRLSYSYDITEVSEDSQYWLSHIEIIFPLLATLVLPGYGLVRLLRLHKIFSPSEQLAIATGLSLAVIPIIYLLATETHIKFTLNTIRYSAYLLSGVIIVLLMRDASRHWIFIFPNYRAIINHAVRKLLTRLKSEEFICFIILIGIILSTLVIRLVTIRDLATPAWVDSIHHGLLTRLIVQAGSLPETYNPFLTVEPTLYHLGFHASLAYFTQLAGLEIDQGMLVFGQAINALAVAASFLLAFSLTRNKTAGLIAALITGMFTVMPAYYTSWGRYPQLAGLIILPIPIALLSSAKPTLQIKQNLSIILGIALASAGLLLVHYRVTFFLICLLIVMFVVGIAYIRSHWKDTLAFNTFILIVPSLLAFALVSPWMVPAIRYTFVPRIAPASDDTVRLFNDFSWNYLTPALGKQAIALAGIGLIWSGIRKARIAWIILSWIGLLFFLANLGALNLPGGNFINSSSVTIMLFMPISVMAGYLIAELHRMWKSVIHPARQYLQIIPIALLALTSSFIGSTQLIAILNPATILSREADIEAIQWVDQNIPDEKVILINSFAWGYGLYAGSDGGAWISALAGNPTIPPPVLYGLGVSAETLAVNHINEEVIRLHTSPEELWEFLISVNIEYIFIGSRGGPLFPSILASNQHFEILYQRNNSWVFRLLP